ncbi:unnamed protein product [Prorocentrum cordatum]|uniref:Uncharacterized protein n=1 Tax=Prorocentrum cordatum TaxID=2364126 RepID=A0ABN9WZG3_9DINO|nr:unnamed protein product [Polarella glacialis]
MKGSRRGAGGPPRLEQDEGAGGDADAHGSFPPIIPHASTLQEALRFFSFVFLSNPSPSTGPGRRRRGAGGPPRLEHDEGAGGDADAHVGVDAGAFLSFFRI